MEAPARVVVSLVLLTARLLVTDFTRERGIFLLALVEVRMPVTYARWTVTYLPDLVMGR